MKRIYSETEEIRIIKKKTYIDIDDSYTQMYDSLSKILGKCKSINEINLIFYAATNSHNGMFNTDVIFYNKFNKHLQDNYKQEISKMTFHTSVSNLVKNKILIKHSRGSYQLNPLLIWRDELSKRKEHVIEITKLPEQFKDKYLIETKL